VIACLFAARITESVRVAFPCSDRTDFLTVGMGFSNGGLSGLGDALALSACPAICSSVPDAGGGAADAINGCDWAWFGCMRA